MRTGVSIACYAREAARSPRARLIEHGIACRKVGEAIGRAEAADVLVERIRAATYIMCATLAGLCGYLLSAFSGGAALNMGEEPATFAPPGGDWTPAGLEINSAQPGADGNLHLAHWQPCIMLRVRDEA